MQPGRAASAVRRYSLVAALALTAIAYLDTLRFGFVADARFLLADNAHLDSWRFLWPTLTHDYFWSSSTAAIPYWRPFTKLAWLAEARLLGRSAVVFHAVQLGWILAAVAGVYALARRLGASAAWAGAAALLFGLHPALVEAGCLLMARSDVTLVAASLWATVAWLQWRADGRARWGWLHAAAFVVALGSKEAAVMLPPVWTAWALLSGERQRLATVAPSWLLAIAYLAARAVVIHGTPAGTTVDVVRLFAGVGLYGWGLLPLRVSTGVRNVSFAEARAWPTVAIAAVVWLALGAGAFVAWRRRATTALALLLFGVASLLPVLGPMPRVPGAEGKYMLAPRWLASAAAVSCVGLVLGLQRLPARLRAVGIGVVALWAVAGLAVARPAHAYYASDATLLALEDEAYEQTPPAFRTVEDRCRARGRTLARAVLAVDADAALAAMNDDAALCGVDDGVRFNVAAALVQAKRYGEARPLVDAVLEHRALPARNVAQALRLAGVVHLHTGDARGAEQMLTAALRGGLRNCGVLEELADAAAAQGHDEAAAQRRREAATCRAR